MRLRTEARRHLLPPTTITWVIVANGVRYRALEELRRGGALRELEAWDGEQTEQDRQHPYYAPAAGGQRFGYRSSAINPRDFEAQAERRFLTRYAHRLSVAGAKGRFKRLILIATPPALSLLREQLARPAQRCVERTATCDCVGETPEALRDRIRGLRMPH